MCSGNTADMARPTQRHVLADLVSAGRLTSAEAESVASAPRMSLPVREIVSYLAGLIVLVGVVRLIVAVLEDASKIAIAAVLYVVALIAGVVAWRLRRHPGAWGRFSEVLELATIGAGGLGIGLTLSNFDVRGEWAAIIPAAVGAVWAVLRIPSARFLSSLVLPITILVISGNLSTILDWHEELGSIPIMFGGAVLIAVGLTRIRLPFIVRGVGAVAVFFTSIALSAQRDGLDGLLPGLLLGLVIFALGSTRMWIDLILPGGVLVVTSISIFVFRHVNNDVLQGVLVIAIGLVVLVVTTVVIRQGRQRVRTVSVP